MLARLLGIVYLLLAKESVTASELAERFEVSVRTIYRDIEALSLAGIPVYTRKGKNGGISLTDNFILNRMMLSKEEQSAIMAALESMQETGAGEEKETLEKLRGLFGREESGWLAIDFSDWSGQRQELFALIKKSILEHRLIEFDYYGQGCEMSHRTAEPVQLLFKDYTWYLRAFCRKRNAMRLFKVMRMKRATLSDETFTAEAERFRECPPAENEPQPGPFFEEVIFHVDASQAWRIYDRFEEEEVTRQEDGSFLIRMSVMVDEWVYGMLFSFGPSACVVAPEHVRKEFRNRLERMLLKY